MKRLIKNAMQKGCQGTSPHRPHKAGLAPRPASRGASLAGLAPLRAGFTLIEVMVAIAVVAIGLTAVLGLLPGAIQSGRTAADNTLAATLAQDAFASMRRQVLALATTGPSWSLGPLGTTPSITYWDAAGVINTPPLPDRYFQVTRAWTPSSLMPNSMLILTATVTWPANAPAASQNSSIFVTEIARYNQ